MKTKNRWMALFVLVALIWTVVGCSAPQKELTLEEKMEKTRQNVLALNSVHADWSSTMRMDASEKIADYTMSFLIDYINDPMQFGVECVLESGGRTERDTLYIERLLVEPSDKMIIYLNGTDGVKKQEYTYEEFFRNLGQYDVLNNLDMILAGMQDIELVGEEDLNGMTVSKYQGVIKSVDLKDILAVAGMAEAILETSEGLDDPNLINDVFWDLGDQPVTLWLDEKGYYPVKIEMDMQAVVDKLYQNYLEMRVLTGELAEDHEEYIKIEAAKLVAEYSNFNRVQPPTKPSLAPDAIQTQEPAITPTPSTTPQVA